MSRDMTEDERDEEIVNLRSIVFRLRNERNAALERAEIEHRRYLSEREVNVALGEERDRMSPVIKAAERWADSFTGTKAYDDLEAVVAIYRKSKP